MRKKLLIIDDQPEASRLIALTASHLGFETRTLSNPSVAATTFLDFTPDVVILDMVMPEKDGIDVLHEILLTGIPARIILTSCASEPYPQLADAMVRFHDAGQTVTTLPQPFRRADLVAALTDDRAPA